MKIYAGKPGAARQFEKPPRPFVFVLVCHVVPFDSMDGLVA
jgi:hypothetical protein